MTCGFYQLHRPGGGTYRREPHSDEVGTFQWWDQSVVFELMTLPKNDMAPEAARAREQSGGVRAFLVWARFPSWALAPGRQALR